MAFKCSLDRHQQSSSIHLHGKTAIHVSLRAWGNRGCVKGVSFLAGLMETVVHGKQVTEEAIDCFEGLHQSLVSLWRLQCLVTFVALSGKVNSESISPYLYCIPFLNASLFGELWE